MTSIDKLFELGIELRNEGALQDAVGVFSKILNDYPNHNKRSGVYTVLGGIFRNLNEHENALINFKNATALNPKYELASAGLYLTYADLDRCKEAVEEVIRYLRQYPAHIYKKTLEELLEGLENGYMTDYKDEISELARINGVVWPGNEPSL